MFGAAPGTASKLGRCVRRALFSAHELGRGEPPKSRRLQGLGIRRYVSLHQY